MFSYIQFFVESSFFREVANHGNVRWLKSFAIQEYFAFIRSCDLINDPDQGGLACAVGPKQSENTAFFHLQAYMIKGYVVRILFQDIPDAQHLFRFFLRKIQATTSTAKASAKW